MVAAPCPHPTNHVSDRRIIRVEQIALTNQRVLDLARKLEPLIPRSRCQVAERTNRLLTRSLRGMDRLHQHVVRIRPAVVGANRFADVHVPLYITKSSDVQQKTSPYLV